MRISGTRALVTGANRGLGLHFVEALLDRGAERVYAAARTPDTLTETVARSGGRVVPVRLDVTDAAQIGSLADDLGDVRLVVSNAGRSCALPVLGPPDEAPFRSVLDVNFFGPLALARAFAPRLQDQDGGFLFVQSLAALIISRSSPIYSASKAAAMMLAAGLRSELRPRGVAVTSTYPGFVDTDMTTGVEIPKASPRAVADRSLDGLEAGVAAVFPDALAELVEQAVLTEMADVLADPQAVMTRLVRAYRIRAT